MANRRLHPTAPTVQIIAGVAGPIADRIETEARDAGVAKSEIIRLYLEAGMNAVDERTRVVIDGVEYTPAS